MERPERKSSFGIIVIAVVFVISVPLIVLSAMSRESDETPQRVIEAQDMDFDYRGGDIFNNRVEMNKEYLEGGSTERTLEGYYSLRQYPGSPPYIPHKVDDEKITNVNCLSCHEKGGWSEELKGNTPLTPHPGQVNCIQCHVKTKTEGLFVENDWLSVSTPLLGRSYLPGSPVPIPHDLHDRGNCIACHVGPGAVTAIRSNHSERGNCRQCHVPDLPMVRFKRDE